jgi:hypothetical protein
MKHFTSTTVSQDFYLFPKNSVDRNAEWLKTWQVSEKDLRSRFRVPEETYFGSCIIVDGGCPRKLLGRNIPKITLAADGSNNDSECFKGRRGNTRRHGSSCANGRHGSRRA